MSKPAPQRANSITTRTNYETRKKKKPFSRTERNHRHFRKELKNPNLSEPHFKKQKPKETQEIEIGNEPTQRQ